ncbi:hypothetical protein EcCFBP13530_04650 [Enterobacter cancerogenus]|uniref:Lipoprotein n=1 Tax=Enterobacter cancerogenus TaxID=69218 RepID=A0AB38PAA6_9ENTR|nr:hypothetical protein [Enterobacter cancerogenus]TKK23448.1 hypothetical protein EcCFBP13530_04650 [Enterobacter cancerogenus]
MKKLLTALMVASSAMLAFSATACPQGTHLIGGTGSHHKGGHCNSSAEKDRIQNGLKKDASQTHKNWKKAEDGAQKNWKKAKVDATQFEKKVTG